MSFSISVIIPTYNRAHFLVDAIRSVVDQTHPVTEVIVVDDGSKDDTAEVVRGFGSRVRYVWQSNAGPAAARNRGLQEATGDWIAFNDSDDLWVPTKVEQQVAFLRDNPAVDFLFGHMANFTAGSVPGPPEILDRDVYDYCRLHARHLDEFFNCLIVTNPVPTPTVMARRALLSNVGPMRTDLRCGEDHDWWLRWAQMAQCGFLDATLILRRLHDTNIVSDRRLMLANFLLVLEGLQGRRDSLTEGQRNVLDAEIHYQRYRLGSEYYRHRDYPKALAVLRDVQPFKSRRVPAFKWLAKTAVSSMRRAVA